MMDVADKFHGKVLRSRLNEAIHADGELSKRQLGFRLGQSTIDAIKVISNTVVAAQAGNRHNWKLVLMSILDIKNAFNSAMWTGILEALECNFQMRRYPLRMIDAYFVDCVLLYNTRQEKRRKCGSAGVAQLSIIGPDLWNVYYDDFLRIKITGITFLIGFCDDAGLVIVARGIEGVQMELN